MMFRDKYGRFVKGIVPWNKGKGGVYSQKVLKRMSNAKKGKHISPDTEFKKGHIPWNKNMKGLYISGSEKGWFKKCHKWSKEIEKKKIHNLRKKVLIKPNLEMNETLAYIIGMLKGDGCVYRNGKTYRICLDITSERKAINFFNVLKRIGLNPFTYEIMPSNGIGKLKKYRVLASSKIFYEWYKKLTLKKLKELLDNKEKIIGFIRGFYEAEGSITKQKDGTIVISMYNTDLKLINLVKSSLEKLGLYFNLNGPYKNYRLGGYNSKVIYRIQTGSKMNVHIFLNLIKPSVKNFSAINLQSLSSSSNPRLSQPLFHADNCKRLNRL